MNSKYLIVLMVLLAVLLGYSLSIRLFETLTGYLYQLLIFSGLVYAIACFIKSLVANGYIEASANPKLQQTSFWPSVAIFFFMLLLLASSALNPGRTAIDYMIIYSLFITQLLAVVIAYFSVHLPKSVKKRQSARSIFWKSLLNILVVVSLINFLIWFNLLFIIGMTFETILFVSINLYIWLVFYQMKDT